jgi:hypothetical protein
MTKRPMLILNGKPRRYEYLVVRLCDVFGRKVHGSIVGVDDEVYRNAQVSQSTRPSGRRVIWVHTEVEDG